MIPSAMAFRLVLELLVSRHAARAGVAACLALVAPWALPVPAGAKDDAPASAPLHMKDPAITPSFKEVDSVEARVQGCVTCHGDKGQGTDNGYFPRIAGKPTEYLFNQLVGFRDGTRRYPPMNYLVAYLPDGYLHEMAAWYSKQRPPFPPKPAVAPDPAALERGKALANVGDQALGLPSCMACHGKALTGMEPGIPGLVGVRYTYLVGQLTRWRTGDRRAPEPDCMKRIATRLSEADISAVSAWLAQQDAPADITPAPASIGRMPMACGSQR
jgi:cytochrome c553